MKIIFPMVLSVVAFGFLVSCTKQSEWKPCDSIPLIDGFRTVKVKEDNWTLKLPSYVAIEQVRENNVQDCRYVKNFSVRYVWYKGKLLSHSLYADQLPRGEAGQIAIRAYASDWQKSMDDLDSAKVSYKYEVGIEHQKFPLAHLPKYEWDDPVNPSKLSLDLSNSPSRWAILGTKNGTPKMHYPFHTFCDFDYVGGKFSKDAMVATGLTKNGDAKCRGSMMVEKNNKYIGVTVDVWANLGGIDQSNIQDINKIYDALVEELNSFIQE